MGRANVIRLLFAVLAVGFFAAPLAARLVGVSGEAFENRRLADAPKLSQGWDAFQQGSRFLVDHMPLRAQAVRANTRIWQDLFGTTPRYGRQTMLADDQALPFAGSIEAPDAEQRGPRRERVETGVLEGDDGWLFLKGELEVACDPQSPYPKAVRSWLRMLEIVRRAGPEAFLFVAPEKGSIYPEHLPEDADPDGCARRGKRQMWSLLANAPPSAEVVPLRDAVLAEKEAAADADVYKRKDSHWNTIGALAMARGVLERVGAGVRMRPSEVVPAKPVSYIGDLTSLLGEDEVDEAERVSVERKAGAPRVPGRVMVITDSFGEAPRRLLRPYFEDLHWVRWDLVPVERIVEDIRSADVVLFEVVERLVAERTMFALPTLTLDLKRGARPR